MDLRHLPVSANVPAALLQQATAWLARDPDATTRATLAGWLEAGDLAALTRAFAGRLAFGTAGLRGQVGPGPNAINALVVRETVCGLLETLSRALPARRPIAIGFDGRLDSARLAAEATQVAVAAGWAVEAFSVPVPTPLVGFWVKQRGLSAGVVITASHNPKPDNGLKVYWQHGVQIAPPVDAAIAAAIEWVSTKETGVPAREPGPQDQVEDVTERAMAAYVAALCDLPSPWPPSEPATAALSLAYSPLHGVGQRLTRAALADLPHVALHVVASQGAPDGHFPTIASPNPEDPACFAEVLALGEAQGADLACLHDPDADRLAVAARWPYGTGAGHGEADGRAGWPLQIMTGDELGLALAQLLLERAATPKQSTLACSLVSSQLLPLLAKAHGAEATVTLPGFKWLARAAMAAQAAGRPCLLAYEEALGLATTSLVWDKDGVAALRLVALLASERKGRGQTLWHAVAAAQANAALSVTCQRSLHVSPRDASRLMAEQRREPAAHVAGCRLAARQDGTDLAAAGTEHAYAHLPPSNWLALHYRPLAASERPSAGDSQAGSVRVVLRPSGTEAKLKVYYEWTKPPVSEAQWPAARRHLEAALNDFVEQHSDTLRRGANDSKTPPG